MSEQYKETPSIARAYCPGCEPDADPCLEILDVRRCELHPLVRSGSADTMVGTSILPSGGAEAGGEANRKFCNMIHRPEEIERA